MMQSSKPCPKLLDFSSDHRSSNTGGLVNFHQLIIQIPTANERNDPYLAGLTEFLLNTNFIKENILKDFGMSTNIRDLPQFLDIVIFAKIITLKGVLPKFA